MIGVNFKRQSSVKTPEGGWIEDEDEGSDDDKSDEEDYAFDCYEGCRYLRSCVSKKVGDNLLHLRSRFIMNGG